MTTTDLILISSIKLICVKFGTWKLDVRSRLKILWLWHSFERNRTNEQEHWKKWGSPRCIEELIYLYIANRIQGHVSNLIAADIWQRVTLLFRNRQYIQAIQAIYFKFYMVFFLWRLSVVSWRCVHCLSISVQIFQHMCHPNAC